MISPVFFLLVFSICSWFTTKYIQPCYLDHSYLNRPVGRCKFQGLTLGFLNWPMVVVVEEVVGMNSEEVLMVVNGSVLKTNLLTELPQVIHLQWKV